MSDTQGPEFKIILIEDNEADVFMVREALEETDFPQVLEVLYNSEHLLEVLHEKIGQHGAGVDLVILDLNLPGKSGREVMSELQADPVLRKLPTAILTSSNTDSGIVREFPLLRSTFAVKTPDLQELVSIMRRFKLFAENSRAVDLPE